MFCGIGPELDFRYLLDKEYPRSILISIIFTSLKPRQTYKYFFKTVFIEFIKFTTVSGDV